MPSTGDHRQLADAALEVLDQQLLPIALQASRLQLELEAFLFKARGSDRVMMRELRLVEFVLCPLEVALADDLLVPGRLGAREFALGRPDRDTRHIGRLLALQDLAADVDLLAAQVDDEALERGALALELVLQSGTFDGREQIALLDRVARIAVQGHRAGRWRIQRRTYRGHDGRLRRDVAEKLAARDGRDAHAIERDCCIRRRPALQEPRQDRRTEHEQRDSRGDADASIVPPSGGLLDDAILTVRAAHARRGNLVWGSLEGGDGHVTGLDAGK